MVQQLVLPRQRRAEDDVWSLLEQSPARPAFDVDTYGLVRALAKGKVRVRPFGTAGLIVKGIDQDTVALDAGVTAVKFKRVNYDNRQECPAVAVSRERFLC